MGTFHSRRRSPGLRPGRGAFALLALCLLLAACGKKPGTATQIAAKVNREEISVHQINHVLQRQPSLAPEQVDAASQQALDALVDQEVVVQAALEQRLDRDPAVVQAIESSRRGIIARAYAERLTQAVQPPTPAEIKQYYDSHPALFAKRKLYSVIDTAVEATPAQQKTLQGQLAGTRNASDVATLLRQSGLRFGSRQSRVGAEVLPLQAVDAVASLREGQSLLVPGARDAHIFTIVDAEPAPLTEERAQASIETFLASERKRQLVQQQVKELRRAARIEYLGRFAELSQAAPAPQLAAALPPAPAPAATHTPAQRPTMNAVALHEGAPSPSHIPTNNNRR